MAGLCLSTEANLGDGIFPATDFLSQGGRPGIGSDSHVSLSVVEELRWLEYGQRLRDRKRNRLYRDDQPMIGRTLYDAALAGGAQVLGSRSGSLAVGRRADLLVLDGNDPYLASAEGDALLNRWLFAGGDRQVRDVMVAGRWVVRDGRHAGGRAQRTGIRPGAGGTARLTLHSGGQPRCAYPPHSFEPSGAKRRYFPRQPPGVNGAGKKNAPAGRSFTGSASTGRRVPARSARPPRNRGCALLPADVRGSAAKPAGVRDSSHRYSRFGLPTSAVR